MRILLVEDSRSSALPIIAFLRQQGHEVSHVTDGKAALESFTALPPDLVLMDVVMPVMDGIEATRRIKALGGTRWVPVLLMTSLSSQDEIVAGLDAGADDYLTKPIVFEVLDARMRSMQRIATIQDSLFGILDNVYEGIITIDPAGTVQSFNKAAERIFGYCAAEVIGHNVKMLMPSPYTEEHDGYLARYQRERTPRIIGIGRKVFGLRKDGEVFRMQLGVTEIRQGSSPMFIGLVRDISMEEAARERIEFLALHDPLTGLPNRAQFTDALDATLKRGGDHAVLFIDLDGFKPINDSLGHEAGDAALKAIASRLRHALAAEDFVARLGGDEFVAILHDMPERTTVESIAQRLIAAISQPLILLGHSSSLGASIGVAMIPEHGTQANAVLTTADNAMYAAKRAGKGCVVVAGISP
jgi:diguanylate cyclase (GGDEF)-like protein/PAS domain S-box-containing protein